MTTPFELEQIRQEEAAKAEKQSAQASQKTVDATLIQDATPEDQKLKGKNNPMFGKKHSKLTKRKISRSLIKKKNF